MQAPQYRLRSWMSVLAIALTPAASFAQSPSPPWLYAPGKVAAGPRLAGPANSVAASARQPQVERLPPVAPSVPADLGAREEQNAPGAPVYDAGRDRQSDPLPEYVYNPDQYDTFGYEVHQLADYAPQGYETRDYQNAPGEPEYTRLTPPVPVSQAERDKFVVGGVVPGSYLAPGTNTSFRLRGFVRLTGLYDLEPIGVPDAFVTNSIPVPQTEGHNFNFSARISRFGIETWTPTTWCDRMIHTFIEGDFFNGPGQAVGGGGNPFRLRHAFFDVGWFRFGQQNSVFMDGTNWPSLVDFQGPNSWTNQRQPLARVTVPISESFYWASSLERPFSNIATNGLGEGVQDVPDFATHLRIERDRGHVQVAGLLRSIGYEPTGGETTHETGAGMSGNFVCHPWAILMGTNPVRDENPSGLTRSRLLMQCTWGRGVARYINDLAGQELDGQVNPVTGEFNTVRVYGWNASYEHWFNEHWLTNATYSQVHASSNPDQPGSTYNAGRYLAYSIWWIPVTRLSFGVECLWGSRKDVSGDLAEATRVNALFQYNF